MVKEAASEADKEKVEDLDITDNEEIADAAEEEIAVEREKSGEA